MVKVRDIVEAKAETDAALQRLLKDQDKPCCHERIAQFVAASNHERELINKWKEK